MKTNTLGHHIWRENSSFHDSFTLSLYWILSVLIACLIFLVPSNLFVKCCESTGYVNGLFIDYLLPKLYLNDLVIFLILSIGTVWIATAKTTKQWQSILSHPHKPASSQRLVVVTFLLIVLLGIRQLIAPHALAATWYFGKLVEMMALGLFLRYFFQSLLQRKIPQILIHKMWQILAMSLALTILFQSSLAIYQYTQQHELIGFHFLGEPQLTQPLSLARITLASGITQVLPYGTTTHPNVLAGVIALYLLLWFFIQQKYAVFKQRIFVWLSLLLILLGCTTLYLTHSFSAWATLAIGVPILFISQNHGKISAKLRQILSGKSAAFFLVLISFCLIPLAISALAKNNPTDMSLTRRNDLQLAAWHMVIDQPVFGVGLNNFTAEVENYTESNELVRFIQPVHHVGWLWLSETGILGLSIVGLVTWLFLKNGQNHLERLVQLTILFLILLPIFSLDHYLLTGQTGLLLGVLCLVFFLIPNPQHNN